MMHGKDRRDRAGYTIIELLIAATLLVLVGGSALRASIRGLELFRTNSAIGEVNARSGRAIERVTRELVSAGVLTLDPQLVPTPPLPTPWSSSLEFRTAADWTAGAVAWGDLQRIDWQLGGGELLNDLDDDGDGLVDEGDVVLNQDVGGTNRTVVLVTGVAELLEGELANGLDDNGNGMVDEAGLCFERTGGTLNVHVTLERLAPSGQRTMTRTLEDALRLRNGQTP